MHNIHVGDLFEWHHRFLQVVDVSEKTVTLRAIRHDLHIEGGIRERVARRDDFAEFPGFGARQNAEGRRCKVLPNGWVVLRSSPRMVARPSTGRSTPPWLQD